MTDRTEKTITLYHAEWCGHCRHFQPHWVELREYVRKHKNDILKNHNTSIIFEDYLEGKDDDKINDANIMGFPTIKIDGEDYEGNRRVSDILLEVIPDLDVNEPDFKKIKAKDDAEKRAIERARKEEERKKQEEEDELNSLGQLGGKNNQYNQSGGAKLTSFHDLYIFYKKKYLDLK